MGIDDVACFAARVGGVFVCENDGDLALDKLGCDFAEPLSASLAPAILDCEIAALAPAEFS